MIGILEKLRQHPLLHCLPAVLLISAVAVRLLNFYCSLQYDELWSWQFFAPLETGRIFFDLSLPNNHPLNTLFIKLVTAATDDLFAIRIFPLVCGVAMLPAVYFAVSVWSGSRKAAAFAALFCAFAPPFVIYSTLARGYMPQAFFFALTAAGMACFTKENIKKYRTAGIIATAVGGTGTILSVPTGIVFLAGLAAAALLRYRKAAPKPLAAVIVCGAVAATAYYIVIIQQLSQATKWSVSGSFFTQSGRIIITTGAGLLTGTVIAAVLEKRKTLPLLVIPFVVLLSGAVSGLGPVRTYIIFTGIFACCSALAAAHFADKKRWWISLLLVIIFFGAAFYNIKNFELPDWKNAEIPKSGTTVCVYPANSGYPMLWNHGGVFLNRYQISLENSWLDAVRVYAPQGVFNGMNASFGEENIQTKIKGTPGFDKVLGIYHTYRLEPYSGTPLPQAAYLIAYPKSPFKITAPDGALRLNPWFEQSFDRSGSCALYFTLTPPSTAAGANVFVIKNAAGMTEKSDTSK